MKQRKIIFIKTVPTTFRDEPQIMIALNTAATLGYCVVIDAHAHELACIEKAVAEFNTVPPSERGRAQYHKSKRGALCFDKPEPLHKGATEAYFTMAKNWSKNQSKIHTAFIVPLPLRDKNEPGADKYPYVNASTFAQWLEYRLDNRREDV